MVFFINDYLFVLNYLYLQKKFNKVSFYIFIKNLNKKFVIELNFSITINSANFMNEVDNNFLFFYI